MPALLWEIAVVAHLHAEFRRPAVHGRAVDAGLLSIGDPQLLASAVMNLLNNAFKFTQVGGTVTVRAGRTVSTCASRWKMSAAASPGKSPTSFRPFADRRQARSLASAWASRSLERPSGSRQRQPTSMPELTRPGLCVRDRSAPGR